ncbi:MAG: ABC transporter substrate-binding protein [Candidatus Eremiobacteraeota bacterium]|nr:ABC transporter substrate-binding protein [Candidatus Eremiobacteraeota bacterium]
MTRCAALVAVIALFVACARAEQNRPPSSSWPRGGARIVTLVPSFADDIAAIGATGQLVGVSAFTDAPGAAALPRVADATGINAEAVALLRPTIVLGIPAQARFVQVLRRAGIRVALLSDDTYGEIFSNLRRMGELTGKRREADATIARLRRRTEAVRAQSLRLRYHPSVFVVLGAAPIWTAGTQSYISALIALAGGRNGASDLQAPYAEYSAEALLRQQPDMLIADPAANVQAWFGREPWRSLRAVRLHRVYALNPDTIERPGPRYADGLEWLFARVAHVAGSSAR